MISLAGKTALVTGGNRGIGRATALLLARSGADVAITYRSRSSDAAAVVTEIQAGGRKAFAVGGDLADEATAEQVVAQCSAELGSLVISFDGSRRMAGRFCMAAATMWPVAFHLAP